VDGAFRENSTQARETNRHTVPLPTTGHTLLSVSLVSPAGGVTVRSQARGANGRLLVVAKQHVPQTMLLFHPHSDELEAVIVTSGYKLVRTAGPRAVGCRYLAPEAPRVLGVMGSSTQARGHVPVLLHEMSAIEEVRIYSPSPEHRERLAAGLDCTVAARVHAVDTAKSAIEEATVLAAVANSEEPTFDPARVKPGARVASIARGQLPPELAQQTRFIASTQMGLAEGGRRDTEAQASLNPGRQASVPAGSLLDVMERRTPALAGSGHQALHAHGHARDRRGHGTLRAGVGPRAGRRHGDPRLAIRPTAWPPDAPSANSRSTPSPQPHPWQVFQRSVSLTRGEGRHGRTCHGERHLGMEIAPTR